MNKERERGGFFEWRWLGREIEFIVILFCMNDMFVNIINI